MAYRASKPTRISEAVSEHRRRIKELFERDGRLGPAEQEEVLAFLLDLQAEMDGFDAVSNLCAAIVKYGEPSGKSIRKVEETGRDLLELAQTVRTQMQLAEAAA